MIEFHIYSIEWTPEKIDFYWTVRCTIFQQSTLR